MQRWSRWEDVRVLEQRKGGNLPGGELLAKLADQDTDGVVAVTEPLGYFPHGLFFSQDGTQDFIPAMEWVAGLQKEGTQECGIHAASSDCGVFFSRRLLKTLLCPIPVNQRQLGPSAENPNKSRENRQSGPG
jgi:hypothetical protein